MSNQQLGNRLVDDYIGLFQGNPDAIGTEQGGSIRTAGYDDWAYQLQEHLDGTGPPVGVYPLVARPATYPEAGIDEKWWAVHWGCIDWDDGVMESWEHALNTQRVLKHIGVTSWIEPSRSKGCHLWVFARKGEWVPAHIVRRGLLMACHVAGSPIKEINPKSEGFDDPNTLGNYVRVCYPAALRNVDAREPCVACGNPRGRGFIQPGEIEEQERHPERSASVQHPVLDDGRGRHPIGPPNRCDGNHHQPLPEEREQAGVDLASPHARGRDGTDLRPISVHAQPTAGTDAPVSADLLARSRRCVVSSNGHPYCVACFVTLAHESAGLDGLEKLAAYWKPQRRADIERAAELPPLSDDITKRMGGLAFTIWKDGPLDGGDRSGALYKLGVHLHDDGMHTFDECLTILTHADKSWGKFYGRADAETRLLEILEKVW